MRRASPWSLALSACVACSEPAASRGLPSQAPASGSADVATERASPVSGPLWERAAASADSLDLLELAEALGAGALLAALDDARYGQIALAALEHAPDAELALATLASRAKKAPGRAEAELEILLALLSAPRQQGERLDPEGERVAVAALEAVAADLARPRRERALAASALGRFAERGLIARERVPHVE
jgi:hypothetical protein